jgi:molybdopterin-containing oxidoreductase family iron-sulfur binding subunit
MEDLPANMTWEEAVDVVSEAIGRNRPSEIAFLLGNSPDHLYDLVKDFGEVTHGNPPIRFGALNLFEARTTLSKATESVFGDNRFPYFDLGRAHLVLSFGANFLETWLSPVARSCKMRRGDPERGLLRPI